MCNIACFKLLVTILVHVWSNFIGIYAFTTRNKISREAFVDARNALAAQHEALQERAKMVHCFSARFPLCD